MANASLQQTMAQLAWYLNDTSIHEIMLNRPNEVWLDNGKTIECKEIDFPLKKMERLAQLIAAESGQIICEERPLLSAVLPFGHRVQVIMAPACKCLDSTHNWHNTVSISIRKKSEIILNLQQFANNGGFAHISKSDNKTEKLKALYTEKNYTEFLIQAVKLKKNILISGGTYSGKTSLLNMLLQYVDKNERIITIEDTPELQIANKNQVRLFYSRGLQNVSEVNAYNLLNATLRMRPDRIIMGELRDDDAICWLQAINTGHEGTLTTIHSDTPMLAIQKLADMVKMKYTMQTDQHIKQYIQQVVDIIIQIKRDAESGSRFISDILFLKESACS